ncbi:rhodanese-like domain-containing protein [Bradyrhizobium sp. CCBAU 51627]|uniref:rhodanese-like domain-containing protein n=1 Tax=Bradyrhizobium sp. CCBAU 51627 TaxID=1325088 RepID=UPI002306B94D|nr:rhodanese-like domain-containing protein [Bradyrhizobium sp. CCBAU 51627]
MTTEISPRQAWDLLAADKHARLVDVRTEPEWAYVGVPDLADLGKAVAKISWHVFPEMRVNPEFIGKLKATYDPANPVIFMCRSGGRSLAAAKAVFEAGLRGASVSPAASRAMPTKKDIAAPRSVGRRRDYPGDSLDIAFRCAGAAATQIPRRSAWRRSVTSS